MSVMLASFVLSSLLAQSPAAPRASVNVTAGTGQTWEDEGSMGNGAAVGVEFDYRVTPHLMVTAGVERLKHHRDLTSLVFDGRTIFPSIGAVYRFGSGRVAPYAGGGFGGAMYRGMLFDRFDDRRVIRSSSTTAFYGSAGVEIPIGARILIAPDFRLTVCQVENDAEPWSAMRFGVKAGVRF